MAPHRDEDQFELKTLKVSAETRSQLRKPFVWRRPSAKLYDYHYEIGGLYYQPMIRYILSKDDGDQRATVDVPERLQTNYDRRAYKLRPDSIDLGDFLASSYSKKAKDINAKRIHVANELSRRSKQNTDLNMIRGAAIDRDKYLCKLQLYYTEKVAKSSDDEMLKTFLQRRGDKEDGRYAPAYRKVPAAFGGPQLQADQSEVFEEFWRENKERVMEEGQQEYLQFLAKATDEVVSKEKTYTRTVRNVDRDGNEQVITTTQEIGDIASPCFLASLKDVQKQVDEAATYKDGRLKASETDLVFRGRLKNERIGLSEKANLMADRFKVRKVPEVTTDA